MHELLIETRRAVLALCDDGALVDRLQDAFEHLQRLQSNPALPDDLLARVGELVADLTYGGDSAAVALQVVSPGDRKVLAARVLAIHEQLATRHD